MAIIVIMYKINPFPISIIRWVQLLSMILTICCCAYVVLFLMLKNQENFIGGNAAVSPKDAELIESPMTFDLKPFDASNNAQARDIFSLTVPSPTAVMPSTPKGQLPDHLKVVGILVGKPSQIVIEDTSVSSTYFINEGHPQNGIRIVRVEPNQMVINYQGQDIDISISKN